MKRFVTLLSLMFCFSASGQMKPLDQVRKGLDPKEIDSLIYISGRCSALFVFKMMLGLELVTDDYDPYDNYDSAEEFWSTLNVSNMFVPETQDEIDDLLSKNQNISISAEEVSQILTASSSWSLMRETTWAANFEKKIRDREIMRGSRMSNKKIGEETNNQIFLMIENYQKISEEYFVATGKKLDSSINSDFLLCETHLKSISKSPNTYPGSRNDF